MLDKKALLHLFEWCQVGFITHAFQQRDIQATYTTTVANWGVGGLEPLFSNRYYIL